METATSSAVALMLGVVGHVYGWPLAAGGSQRIADALASYFRSLGGEVRTDCVVRRLGDLPTAQRYFFDLTPRQLLAIEGLAMRPGLRRRLARYRYGPCSASTPPGGGVHRLGGYFAVRNAGDLRR